MCSLLPEQPKSYKSTVGQTVTQGVASGECPPEKPCTISSTPECEEGELRNQASTDTNVVLGGFRTKPELDDSKHVLREGALSR
jgi:hypothetical protein